MPTKTPPPPPDSKDIEIYRGTTQVLEVTISGLGVSIAGALITLLVKARVSDADSAAVITKTVGNGGIVITQDGSATLPAIFQVTFNPPDTSGLPLDPKSYEYDCKISVGGNIYQAIEISHFVLMPVVTQAVV